MERYTISWYIPKRVILIRYETKEITSEMFREVNEKLRQFLDDGEPPVHIISDNASVEKVPANFSLTKDSFSTMQRSGWGWVILIGVNPITKFLSAIIGNVFNLDLRTVDSMDEALEVLKRTDPALPFDEEQ